MHKQWKSLQDPKIQHKGLPAGPFSCCVREAEFSLFLAAISSSGSSSGCIESTGTRLESENWIA